WYRRASMTAESGRLRITLDERLTFCRAQTVGVVGAEVAPSPSDVISPGPARILEVKHWGDRPLWLSWALDGMEPAREFSKFKMGMAALHRKREALIHPAAQASSSTEETGTEETAGVADTTTFAPTVGTA